MIFNNNQICVQNGWMNEEDWKATLVQTIFWMGNIIGTFMLGISNDK